MTTPSANSNIGIHNTDRWYFTKEQIINSPSYKTGLISTAKETSYRQHAALFIQEMGQKLNVNQLCINTAIVYMHRFFTCHSFTVFHRNNIARACIFLSAKVEEQPRRLETVINTAHFILNSGTPANPRANRRFDTNSEEYKKEVEELVRYETIILQTLGFEVTVDHPHTHVVRAVQQLKVTNSSSSEGGPSGGHVNDLARSSYFMATQSLHLTTFCLQYKPNLGAAVCIHIACKWTNFEIDHPNPDRDWWELLGSDITLEQLNSIANEFLKILENTPTKLKKKLIRPPQMPGATPSGSVRREAVKRPRPEGEPQNRPGNHNPHHAVKSEAMEKSVSDKLDLLIGSSITKTKVNGSSSSHKVEERRPNHEHHRQEIDSKRPCAISSASRPPANELHKSSPHLPRQIDQHKSSPHISREHKSSPSLSREQFKSSPSISREQFKSSPSLSREQFKSSPSLGRDQYKSSPLVGRPGEDRKDHSLHVNRTGDHHRPSNYPQDHRSSAQVRENRPPLHENRTSHEPTVHDHRAVPRDLDQRRDGADDERNKHSLKKPKIKTEWHDPNKEANLKKLEQRMKKEQLDTRAPVIKTEPGISIKEELEDSPPPPPPPPPPPGLPYRGRPDLKLARQ